MARQRNTDIEIWRDPWFRKLPPLYKTFWRYLCDNADDAGVWKEDLEMAIFQIGSEISKKDAFFLFNDTKERLKEFKTGYWQITGFIEFHYGELSEACKFHKHVLCLVSHHGLDGFTMGSQTLKDKDKYKDTGKGKDKGDSKGGLVKPTKKELSDYFTVRGLEAAQAEAEAQQFLDHYESVGWVIGKTRKPMKSWPGAASTWLSNWHKWGKENTGQSAPARIKSDKKKCYICSKEFPESIFRKHSDSCEADFRSKNPSGMSLTKLYDQAQKVAV